MTTQVKRPTGRDEVVEALLDAAARLFDRAGPADVSLREIAREANVNHGLVHRHFGTRDDLVDRLLQRMAADWTARTLATGDFTAAIESILGDPAGAEASAGSWLRLLAWSLLTDAPGRSAEPQRRYATLDLLPAMLDGGDGDGDRADDGARIVTAQALALVFGWRFFHPYLRAALHLDDVDYEHLHEAMRDAIGKLLVSGGPTRGA